MNPNWRSFLEAAGAVYDSATPEVLHFGNAPGELQAAQAATVLTPLLHLGLIACSGEDAKSFLHNQLTSDVNHLGPEQAQHSAWCTAKGRMLASFLAWNNGDGYELALASELVAPVLKRLQMFVLRSDVRLSDLSDSHILLGLCGPQAGDALAAANLPMPAETLATVAAAGTRIIRLDADRIIIATPAGNAGETWRQLAAIARPAGGPVWRWLDIRAGLPLVTAATREEFVPQMADFEKIGGVSFHKGCYPGQEVVARTQYLGKVKRHLYRLTSATCLQAGDDLHSPDNPDQACGKVVSAAPSPAGGFEALAVVQSNFAQDVHVGTKDGPTVEAAAVNP
ncbi:MAG: Glycine cleavage protein (aminomethyl transferase) [Rhodocyclaceae bacterium]|nr:Glycine cleavage protein (aminomethyl transferase) [Rhodocyclaceae bacterium]